MLAETLGAVDGAARRRLKRHFALLAAVRALYLRYLASSLSASPRLSRRSALDFVKVWWSRHLNIPRLYAYPQRYLLLTLLIQRPRDAMGRKNAWDAFELTRLAFFRSIIKRAQASAN